MNRTTLADRIEAARNATHGDGTELRHDHPIAFHRAVTIASENEKEGKCTTTKR